MFTTVNLNIKINTVLHIEVANLTVTTKFYSVKKNMVMYIPKIYIYTSETKRCFVEIHSMREEEVLR